MARRKWFGPPKQATPKVVNPGTWLERHPTRYFWDNDVYDLIQRIFREFTDISANTYNDHPEGWSKKLGYNTARRSVDFWHRDGRGVPIFPEKGRRIVEFVMEDPNPPWVNWVIWEGRIWSRNGAGVWTRWVDDGTGPHFDHPHFTFMPAGFNPRTGLVEQGLEVVRMGDREAAVGKL